MLCGGGVPRRRRCGSLARTRGAWARMRDGEIAATSPSLRTPPCTSSWHRRIRHLRALLSRVVASASPEPRALRPRSRSRRAHRRAAESVLAPALLACRIAPCLPCLLLLLLRKTLTPAGAFSSAFASTYVYQFPFPSHPFRAPCPVSVRRVRLPVPSRVE
ncbi:hypothetical protein DFH09DRAFT_1331190 [Mycena vulgaris]|nr:hypothetical protein DFH09DRAFT_1331190 [Mycena vulgaris]